MQRFVFSVMAVYAIVLTFTVCSHAPVYHEPAHLAAGLSHVQLRRFDLYRVNPPVVRAFCALIVNGFSPKIDWTRYDVDPLNRPEMGIGADFLRANGTRMFLLITAARSTTIFLCVLGACLCYRWSRTLHGTKAGICAALLWCLSPFILGHGTTIIPDVPSAALGAASIYCFWRWLQRPKWLEMTVAGVVLGLAQLCKFTLLVFYPLLPILWVVYRLPEWKAGTMAGPAWRRQGGMIVAMLLISAYIINCGYLFEGTFTPLREFSFQTTLFTGCESLEHVPPEGANPFAEMWLGKFPIPLPANMVQGIDTQRYDFERGLPSYLRGQWQKHGWWHYYLYALAIKVPLGSWCLVCIAVGMTVFRRGYSAPWRDEMVVLMPGLVLLVFVSSQTGFSVHSRYVIPALPFFFVWASKVARLFGMQPLKGTQLAAAAVVTVALTWSIGSSLWVYPHSLSYFNELVSGPKRGGEHLLESNIDWGQDLFYLEEWLDEHPETTLDGLAIYGSYPPTLAGIPQTLRPPLGPPTENSMASVNYATDHLGPKPGWYALSVNDLYERTGQYRYFLDHFQPVAMAGYSIYIYHITPRDANRVRGELGLPELPVREAGSAVGGHSKSTVELGRWASSL